MKKINQFKDKYAFLSNFFPARVLLEDLSFRTVEHAYQAAKTLNRKERRAIQKCATASEAKHAGRTVTKRPGWDTVKIEVMEGLVRQKFYAHENLAIKFCRTNPAYLEEGNLWHDKFWGVDLTTGDGRNHLGIILMKIRDEFINSPYTDEEERKKYLPRKKVQRGPSLLTMLED